MNKLQLDLVQQSAGELIESVYQEVIGAIPEEINPSNFADMSKLLVKLPNDYAYINQMLAHSRYLVRHYKRIKSMEEYENMMDKRDALIDMASTIKLQYQGVSRVISSYEVSNEYNNMHQSRLGGHTYDG